MRFYNQPVADPFKDAIREEYMRAIKARYKGSNDKLLAYLDAHKDELDDLIMLDDLVTRVQSELDLYADELEFSLVLDEDDE